MASTQVLHTIHCPTVDCFFKQIDDLRINQQHQTWLFRGQNRDWSLTPPSLRCEFIVPYVFPALNYMRDLVQRRMNRELDTNEHLRLYGYVQRRIEQLVVRRFVEVADRAHLYVPFDSRFELGGERFKIDPDELLTAVKEKLEPIGPPTSIVDALAQHHRVPTRLLDFTYNPYVAALFATFVSPDDEKERNQDKHDPIVVWAVNYTSLELKDSDLKLVVQPRTRIGFLQAQDGVFLYDKNVDEDIREKKGWESFEAKFARDADANTYFKFEIPFAKCDHLRLRLRQFGIFEPSIMPSFDVVRKWTLDYYADYPQTLYWVPQ